jgi:hypothetical protein
MEENKNITDEAVQDTAEGAYSQADHTHDHRNQNCNRIHSLYTSFSKNNTITPPEPHGTGEVFLYYTQTIAVCQEILWTLLH